MSILSGSSALWLVLAVGLILVAVFGPVPSISKWLWVACIVAVGAWGAAGYGKAALQARHTREAGDKLLQAEQAPHCWRRSAHRCARDRGARPHAPADRGRRRRRTRNAEAARRAAARRSWPCASALPPRRATCPGDDTSRTGRRCRRAVAQGEGPLMRAAALIWPPCWPAARRHRARRCAISRPPASVRCRPVPRCPPSARAARTRWTRSCRRADRD